MKTTKKLAILCLVLILLLCCMMPTYSWYSHDGVKGADADASESKKINVSELHVRMNTSGYINGTSLTGSTLKGSQDQYGEVFYSGSPISGTTFTAQGMGAGGANRNPYEAATNKPFHTSLFKTTIKNSSDKDVSVGLYIQSAFDNTHPNLIFGTSDPVWNRIQKSKFDTAPKPKKSKPATKRIYYAKETSTLTYWDTATTFYVVSNGEFENTKKVYKMTKCGGNNYYYADIPLEDLDCYISLDRTVKAQRDERRSEKIHFATYGWNSSNYTTRALVVKLQNETYGSVTSGGVVDKTKSYHVKVKYNSGASTGTFLTEAFATVNEYTSKLFLTAGSTTGSSASVALESGKYVGNNVTYTSTSNIINVNSSTGAVSVNGDNVEGTAIVTITVKNNSKNDPYVVKTAVSVKNSTSTIPLVNNILVPKKKNGNDGEATVEWYIENPYEDDIEDINLMLTL